MDIISIHGYMEDIILLISHYISYIHKDILLSLSSPAFVSCHPHSNLLLREVFRVSSTGTVRATLTPEWSTGCVKKRLVKSERLTQQPIHHTYSFVCL